MSSSHTSKNIASPAVETRANHLIDCIDDHNSNKLARLDAVAFLNEHISTETELNLHLHSLRVAVDDRIAELDHDISEAVSAQAHANRDMKTALQQLAHTKVASQHITERVQHVQQMAAQSEDKVTDITKDMRRLDLAKKHLQTTITTLKRLHMLLNAVDRLEDVTHRELSEAANLLDAVNLLLSHFQAYKGVKKLEDIRGRVNIIQDALLERIQMELKVFRPEEDTDTLDDHGGKKRLGPHVVLSDVCLLLEALGPDLRAQQVDHFCSQQLQSYDHEYHPFPPISSNRQNKGGLEFIDERYAWFRSMLGYEDWTVFPKAWNVPYRFTCLFLEKSREHLESLLNPPKNAEKSTFKVKMSDKTDETNVTNLLQALQKTMLFEKEMTAKLEREFKVVFQVDSKSTYLEFDDDGNAVARDGAAGIRLRYERKKFEDNSETGKNGAKVPPIVGKTSEVFDSFMTPYVSLERQNMSDEIEKALKDESIDSRGERPVYTSSTDLFIYIKNSINRCTVLSRGHTFFMLTNAFKESLQDYSKMLIKKMPSPINPATSLSFGTSVLTSSIIYRIPADKEVTICHVIDTCDYCAETIEALQELIYDQIDDKYKDQVDMIDEQEMFHDVTAKAIQILVSGLESRLESSLKEMASTNWGTVEVVGEESDYVRSINQSIEPFVDKIQQLMPPTYFRSFCDKFANVFIASYTNVLTRQKRISESGTQQLLLDVYNLKTLLLKLPDSGASAATTHYSKNILKEFARIEMLLKLVGTPENMLGSVFKSNWPDGSAANLQTIMTLKGMKKIDQQTLLDSMGLPTPISNTATAASSTMSENLTKLSEGSSAVANKVTSDLTNMRNKVDMFRKTLTKV